MKRIVVREDKKNLTLNEQNLQHFQEMAAVGEIQNPKIGKFYLEVFSNEYENETPHVTLEVPQKPNKFPVAKIEIKSQQPGPDDEPHFIWVRDRFNISGILKKEIQKWFVTPNKKGSLVGIRLKCIRRIRQNLFHGVKSKNKNGLKRPQPAKPFDLDAYLSSQQGGSLSFPLRLLQP